MGGDGDATDPVTDDPNNIITINDFTRESDPNKCHEKSKDKTVDLSVLIENQFPQFVRKMLQRS